MKAFLTSFAPLVIVIASSSVADAKSWVFRRSYYSHDQVKNVQVGPPANQFKTGPYFTRSQGSYVRGAIRRQRSFIRVGGQVFDHHHQWEAWVQTGQKY